MALDLAPATGGKRHRLRLALTMAWCDIRRHRGRSALIVALIALPIFAMSLAATMSASMLPTPAETVALELGQTQGRIAAMYAQNSTSQQGPQGDLGPQRIDAEPDPHFIPPELTDMVPAGYEALPWRSFALTAPVGSANVDLPNVAADVLHPAFAGKYTLLDGRAPTSESDALGSPGLLDRFGLKLGEKLTTSAGTFTIVGTIRDSGSDDGLSMVYLKQEQVPAPIADHPNAENIYLLGQNPLTWADAKEFNTRAVILTSRSLILDPPPAAEIGPDAKDLTPELRPAGLATLSGSLLGVLALLEVGLLAGAAFAVGARKQQRDLALLAASGAESSMIRATVSAGGLWLGVAGGVVGAVLGSIGAVISVLVLQSQGSSLFPGVHLMWPVALGLIAVGVAAGLAAAMVPAHAVAKQATLAALKSGRTADAPSRWTARIGLGLLALTAVLMAATAVITWVTGGNSSAHSWVFLLIIAGAVTLVISLICLTGTIIRVLTARTSWLPIPLRLASRDAARNRGRTVPAVAAVLAAATLSGALMVLTASLLEQLNNSHHWQYNVNQAGIPLEFPSDTSAGAGAANPSDPPARIDPEKLAPALKSAVGQDILTQVLRGTPDSSLCYVLWEQALDAGREEPEEPCIAWALQEPAANRCELAADHRPKDLDDWRCNGSMALGGNGGDIPDIVVGGEKELTALLGRDPSSAASQTLLDGGMVLTNRIHLNDDQTTTVITYDPTAAENNAANGADDDGTTYQREELKAASTQSLPAVVDAPDKPLGFYGVVSPETAVRLGIPVDDRLMLLTVPQKLSPQQTDDLQGTLASFTGQTQGITVESGPTTNITSILWIIVSGAALITLSAAGITAGLALADGRSDHATLASVGADPRLRKALAGSQTFLTAFLGTVMGLFAGAVPIVVLLSLFRGMPIVIPWLHLGVLMILVPLFGAAAAWMFTKGKLPMTKRQTLA